MPLALLVIGLVFLIAAVRGTHGLLFETLKDDFTGPNNFIYWGLALFVISAAGYYRPLRPLSNAFMLLVVLVLFLSNRGFFQKFMEQIGSTQRGSTYSAPRTSSGGGGGGGGGSNEVQMGVSVAQGAAEGFAQGGPIGAAIGAARKILGFL